MESPRSRDRSNRYKPEEVSNRCKDDGLGGLRSPLQSPAFPKWFKPTRSLERKNPEDSENFAADKMDAFTPPAKAAERNAPFGTMSASKAEGSVFSRLGTRKNQRSGNDDCASDGELPHNKSSGRRKKLSYEKFKSRGKPLYMRKHLSDEETDTATLERRQKQIDMGKETMVYKHYSKVVPQYKRKPTDPWTPRKEQKASRRCFDGQIKSWRRALHKYNPTAPFDPKLHTDKKTDDERSSCTSEQSCSKMREVSDDDFDEETENCSWFEITEREESEKQQLPSSGSGDVKDDDTRGSHESEMSVQ